VWVCGCGCEGGGGGGGGFVGEKNFFFLRLWVFNITIGTGYL